jgi:hypothetical protein
VKSVDTGIEPLEEHTRLQNLFRNPAKSGISFNKSWVKSLPIAEG